MLVSWRRHIRDMLRKLKEQRGATAVEYALMVGFIAAVIVVSVTSLGSAVNEKLIAFVVAM